MPSIRQTKETPKHIRINERGVLTGLDVDPEDTDPFVAISPRRKREDQWRILAAQRDQERRRITERRQEDARLERVQSRQARDRTEQDKLRAIIESGKYPVEVAPHIHVCYDEQDIYAARQFLEKQYKVQMNITEAMVHGAAAYAAYYRYHHGSKDQEVKSGLPLISTEAVNRRVKFLDSAK